GSAGGRSFILADVASRASPPKGPFVNGFRPLRIAFAAVLLVGSTIATTSAASPQHPPLQHESVCESHRALCADPYDSFGDGYVGHDEPSVLFKSSVPGSGNDITYEL